MALTAILKLNGKEYNIKKCKYEFHQPIDENGIPCAYPRGGIIDFTFESEDSSGNEFYEWMFSKTEAKEGVFEFTLSRMAKEKNKSLKFEKAYCIFLKEYFDSQDDNQMYTRIKLSAAIMSFGEARRHWYINNEFTDQK